MADDFQTQCESILELLIERGERGLTAMEILAEAGSARGAARIKDLRDRGYKIRTDHIKKRRATIAKYVYEGRVEDRAEPPAFQEVSLWP
jgi:hypothetical protein